MPCARGLCTADNIFIFINIAFAMYSGALLATAARLAWDPSTYTWFRFLCEAQYRASAAYVLAAGLWLAALVYLAAVAARRSAATCLHFYAVGVVCLAVSEIAYGAWMVTSLISWWQEAPQAELVRHGMDLLHDFKPALLAVEKYRDVARPIYDMIEEVEREAPNNVYVIIVFSAFGMVLQVAAFIMARRLARRTDGDLALETRVRVREAEACSCACEKRDDDSDSDARDPGWRKKANLRMYTILDKIF